MNSQFLSTFLAAATAKKLYKRQVAYLESTGTQYLLLPFGFEPTDELTATAFLVDAQSTDRPIVGTYPWNSPGDTRFSMFGKVYWGGVGVKLGIHFGNGNNIFEPTLSPTSREVITISYSNRVFRCGESQVDTSDMSFAAAESSPVSIFRTVNGNYVTGGIIGYRHAKANGNAVDLIPVLDWNDRPAMYDKVSRQLFYNQGTGEFLIDPADWRDDEVFTIDLAITADNLTFGVQPYWNTGGWCNILDWGDGQSQAATTSGTALTHTFASAGSYRVKVRGDMYRFRVGSTNPAAVIDCNGNWDALGNITIGTDMFRSCSNGVFAFASLPTGLVNGFYMFYQCSSATLPLSELPVGLTNGERMFQNCALAQLSFDTLPVGFTSIASMLEGCNSANILIDNFAQKIIGEWSSMTSINYFAYRAGGVGGHVATFLRKAPKVNSTAGAFMNNSNVSTFGDNDYFEITLTTTEANQVWGFTATSSEGRWYCFDWGDGTAVTANKNLDVFTSGTKVSHTFATPGTYHIKLATAPCSIVFDEYDSDNGNYEALGWPLDNVAGVFVKEGTTTVSSAMTMTAATITSGQSQMVYNHGLAASTTLSAGLLRVYSGGRATQAIIHAAAHVYNGGFVSSADTTGAGRLNVSSGGAAYDMTVSSAGHIYVSSGGYAGSTTVGFNGGMWSFNGGSSVEVVVQSGGSLTMSSGGWCSVCNISSGGSLIVQSGGTALAVTSNAGATVTVLDGGYIEYV